MGSAPTPPTAEAVARLYEAKGRPSFNPLIAHVSDAAAARALAHFDHAAERLAEAFWPGPLTLVLPRRADCPVAELATAGLDTIAVRVPSHPVARDILAAVGRPLVAPSANRSGHVSPTTAQHVLADLRGRIELIVDGGQTPMGLESTIVACLDAADAAAAGRAAARGDRARGPPQRADARSRGRQPTTTQAPVAPGQLASHYAPRARLRLTLKTSSGRGAARLRSAGGRRCRPCRAGAQPVCARRSHRSCRQPVLPSARARCRRGGHHRGDAGAARGPRRGDQ